MSAPTLNGAVPSHRGWSSFRLPPFLGGVDRGLFSLSRILGSNGPGFSLYGGVSAEQAERNQRWLNRYNPDIERHEADGTLQHTQEQGEAVELNIQPPPVEQTAHSTDEHKEEFVSEPSQPSPLGIAPRTLSKTEDSPPSGEHKAEGEGAPRLSIPTLKGRGATELDLHLPSLKNPKIKAFLDPDDQSIQPQELEQWSEEELQEMVDAIEPMHMTGLIKKLVERLSEERCKALSFQDISLKNANGRYALRKVSGFLDPGQTCAILSAPDAGTTNLLNVLAGRQETGEVTGEVLYDGRPRDDAFQRHVGYVAKEDQQFAILTVKETLTFSARCRTTMRSKKLSEFDVNLTMKLLGLSHTANTFIGDAIIKGVSGGERRRVSYGVEMVAGHSCIIADLPTNGLDSASALDLIRTIRFINRSGGRAMICSIVQPAPALYHLFDSVMLLAKGSVIYFGPTTNALDFVVAAGFVRPPQKSEPQFLEELTARPEQFYQDKLSRQSTPTAQEEAKHVQTQQSPAENGGQKKAAVVGERNSGDAEQQDDGNEAPRREPEGKEEKKEEVKPEEEEEQEEVPKEEGKLDGNDLMRMQKEKSSANQPQHGKDGTETPNNQEEEPTQTVVNVVDSSAVENATEPKPDGLGEDGKRKQGASTPRQQSGSSDEMKTAQVEHEDEEVQEYTINDEKVIGTPKRMTAWTKLTQQYEESLFHQRARAFFTKEKERAAKEISILPPTRHRSRLRASHQTPAPEVELSKPSTAAGSIDGDREEGQDLFQFSGNLAVVDLTRGKTELELERRGPAGGGHRFNRSLLQQVEQCCRRQFVLTYRTPGLWLGSWIKASLMAVVVGTLFLNIASVARNGRSILALFFFLVNYIGVGAVEILAFLMMSRGIYYQQRKAGYFRGVAYYIAVLLSQVPLCLVESFLFALIVYSSVDLRGNVGSRYFWFFWLQLMFTNLTSRCLIFAISNASPNPVVAFVVSPICTVVLVSFSGFLERSEAIPIGWRWMNFVTFYTWAWRGLAINELSGLPLSFPSLQAPFTDGTDVLTSYNIDNDEYYKWFDMLWLVLNLICYAVLGSVLILSVDWSRPDTPETPDFGEEAAARNVKAEQAKKTATKNIANDTGESQPAALAATERTKQVDGVERETAGKPPRQEKSASSTDSPLKSQKRNGYGYFQWQQLGYTVTLSNGQERKLLTDCFGLCKARPRSGADGCLRCR